MTSSELKVRVGNLEDSLIERKRGFRSDDQIRKAVVSLANSVPQGRTAVLFMGVDDAGAVTGVSPKEAEQFQQRVRRICEEDCYPAIAIRLAEVIPFDDKHVLAFEFAPSAQRPHFAGHAYIRVGSASVRASASQLAELIARHNSKAGALLDAKENGIHVTLILPVGSRIGGGPPLSRRRDFECIIQACDAHQATFFDVASSKLRSLPLEYLVISQDIGRSRPLVEYTHVSGI